MKDFLFNYMWLVSFFQFILFAILVLIATTSASMIMLTVFVRRGQTWIKMCKNIDSLISGVTKI